MSLQTLGLEKLHLTLASEKLKLDIASTVDIRFPSRWSPSWDNDEIVKALTSGHIWVSRGRRCRVDIEISFNRKPLHSTTRIAILESIGYHLREAHLWSQLSLAPSLEISQSIQTAVSSTDISIFINNGASTAKTQPKAWLLDNIDIKAPKSVLPAEFERLHIQLSFHQIQKGSRPASKRVKSAPPDLDSPESMLFDYISGLEGDARSIFFQTVAGVLPEDLSSSIAKYFDGFEIGHGAAELHDKMLLPSQEGVLSKGAAMAAEIVASDNNLNTTQLLRRGSLPKEATDKLKAWVDAHSGNLNPTRQEKLELTKVTGLRRDQLNGWFCNARRPKKRSKNTLLQPHSTVHKNGVCTPCEILDENVEEDMLFSNLEDDILFDGMSEYPGEDEMLLSQTTSTTPSLTSQSSTLSTFSSATSLKHPAENEIMEPIPTSTLKSLPLKSANKLSNLALHTLIVGSTNRKRDLNGITIRKTPPSMSLSALVPTMFSPGFKEIMAHNSKFLPTISNAVSSSWVRNVQGVGLRQKLVALSNSKVSEYHEGNSEDGSVGKLAAVVQGRLWTMMQKALYDESAAKKLWRKEADLDAESTNTSEEGYEDEGMLSKNEGEQHVDGKERDLDDHAGENSMDDDDLFNDILKRKEDRGSNDGLLDYFGEQERLAVETETEEMLFGSDFEPERSEVEEIDEILLFREGSQEESMLLLEDGSHDDGMLL